MSGMKLTSERELLREFKLNEFYLALFLQYAYDLNALTDIAYGGCTLTAAE